MLYKFLGVVVWRGARWYVRRKFPDAPRKLLVAGVLTAGLAAGGAVAAAAARGRSRSA